MQIGRCDAAHCIRSDTSEYNGPPDTTSEPKSAYLQQIPRKMHPHTVNRSYWLLFDTQEDPYEQENFVYDRYYQNQKEYCQDLLQQWMTETGDQFELPDIGLP